ncbi:MAG TPA: polysaccharide deacetylase family protein [Bacillota bacterium]|nr:polysaccharide deacetylase family protein [Bacillota bacterium]
MKKGLVIGLLAPNVIGAIFFGRLLYTSSTMDPSQINVVKNASAAVTPAAKTDNSSTPQADEPSPQTKETVVEKTIGLPAFQEDLPYGKLTSKIPYPNHDKTVYLTFDDGPGDETREIESILERNKIRGSFFWVGHNLESWIDKDPTNQKFAQDMVSKGDIIGSHTMNHTAMSHKSLPVQIQMMKDNAALITEKVGSPITYFRPPYGSVDHNTLKASETEKEIIAYWHVDSEDWKYPNNPEKVLSNIMNEVQPGSIILMHEKPTSAAMLQNIIDSLKEKGYEFSALPSIKTTTK